MKTIHIYFREIILFYVTISPLCHAENQKNLYPPVPLPQTIFQNAEKEICRRLIVKPCPDNKCLLVSQKIHDAIETKIFLNVGNRNDIARAFRFFKFADLPQETQERYPSKTKPQYITIDEMGWDSPATVYRNKRTIIESADGICTNPNNNLRGDCYSSIIFDANDDPKQSLVFRVASVKGFNPSDNDGGTEKFKTAKTVTACTAEAYIKY